MTIETILGFGREVTELGYVLTAVYAFGLWLLVRLVLRAWRRMSERVVAVKGKTAATTTAFFGAVLKVAAYSLAVYLVLVQFKAFKSLGNLVLGASSVVGVAVALAAQESMANLVGGIFLSVYQPFRVNDLVYLPEKNITGRVREIGMRHTILLTTQNTEVIIPNSVMNSTIIENRDLESFYTNFLVFSISYSSSIDQAMEIIGRYASNHPLLLDNRSPADRAANKPLFKIVVIDLGAYSVDLRLSFATKNAADGFAMCCDLRKSVKEAFDKEGVVIPFPTTEIIDNSVKNN